MKKVVLDIPKPDEIQSLMFCYKCTMQQYFTSVDEVEWTCTKCGYGKTFKIVTRDDPTDVNLISEAWKHVKKANKYMGKDEVQIYGAVDELTKAMNYIVRFLDKIDKREKNQDE